MPSLQAEADKHAHEAKDTAQRAEQEATHAATNPLVAKLFRLGYAVKGVVYILIGVLAAAVALHAGGTTTDNRGVLYVINGHPFGRFALGLLAVGLAGYALWNLVLALLDPEHKGSEPKGIATRLGYGFIGVSWALLAFGATRLALGTGDAGKTSDQSARDWTARLLQAPSGPLLVVLAGVAVFGVACVVFYQAFKAPFRNDLRAHSGESAAVRWTTLAGRIGFTALGIVFTEIAVFMVVAALRHDPNQARGLGGALRTLLQQPLGPYLLGLVALGLIAFGLFSLAEARYRRVGRG